MTKEETFDLMQFRENMGLLGLESTSILADRIFAVMNKTGNGHVTFDEYLFYMDILTHGSEDEKAELSYKLITKGMLDPITYAQFAEMIISIWKLYNTITGSRVIDSEASIQTMFTQLDLNHDNLVDMREYKQCWKTNRQLFVWFELISSRMSGNVKVERPEEDTRDTLLQRLQELEGDVAECLQMLRSEESPLEEIEGLTPDNSDHEDESWVEDHAATLPACPLLGDRPVLTASRKSEDVPMITETSESRSRNLTDKLRTVLDKIVGLKLLLQDEEQKEEEQRKQPTLNMPPKRTLSKISWGDENWNLIVNMMLGIQKAVRSASATDEILTELSDSFFSQKCKHVVLPLPVGAAAAKNKIYKFRDYAPFVFERIRHLYGVSAADYVKSLGVDKILESWLLGSFSSLEGLCSSGKSGSFFFYSEDGKYMMKTLPKEEFLLFRKMLKGYFKYLTDFPNSLITRVYGLHKILFKKKLRLTRLYFIVMGNVFGKSYEIHSRYDLKGSRIGRSTEKALDHDVARKDLDFDATGMKLQLGAERRALLISIVEQDCQFLQSNGLIDYSVLVGIHGLPASWSEPPRDLLRFVPFAEMNDGGLLSTDGTMLYFIGIIDILTFYGSRKKLEHAAKSIIYDNEAISCVPPKQYAERFITYLASIIE